MSTHTIERRVAARDATPATTVVAVVNFLPVPPSGMVATSSWRYGQGQGGGASGWSGR